MLKEDEIFNGDTTNVQIACPQCFTKKRITLPNKLIQESSHLITVSIPVKFMCDHGFQVFIDKQFQIRGYQSTDYDITEIEIYETGSKPFDGIINYKLSSIIKKTIDTLTESEREGDLLGGALLFIQGNILYFSLPDEIFLKMIQQLELQKQDQETKLHKMIFVLEDRRKVFAKFLKAEGYILIIIVLFPSKFKLSEANAFLNDFVDKITLYEEATEVKKKEQIAMKKIETAKKKKIIIEEPSHFWIYAKVTHPGSLANVERVYIESLGTKIDKKNILNLDEIIKKKDKTFEGKIYFSEKYVRLMEGLALTIKDASVFLSQLNKMP